MADPELTASGPLPESVLRGFEELGLSPYEARIVLALVRVGSANSAELARLSGVPRTSTYRIIEELGRKGLAQRLPVGGPATWASPGRDEVMDRLDAFLDDRFRQQRVRTARLRDVLATTFPDTPSPAGPSVHVIHGAAHLAAMYERLLSQVESELLVFNRPPYSQSAERVNPAVLDAVARGVRARALYQARQWDEPQAHGFRAAMNAYHAGGVEGAVVDHLPVKLAVADGRVALVAITSMPLSDTGFPTTLLVEHPGFAEVQAHAFNRLWEGARLLAAPA